MKLALGAAALLVLGGAIAAVAVAWRGSGGGSPVATAPLTVGVSHPASPPPGAVVVAAESGNRAVALAVGHGRLTATVLAASGSPQGGLSVSFRLGARVLKATPCGAGCYTAAASHPSRVEVRASGGPPVSFRIPARPRPAAAIFRRATAVYRGLHSLVYFESLRSTPTGGLDTRWEMEAPNRFAYKIKGGASGIVIGDRRWDQTKPGGAWTRPQQTTPSRMPVPPWIDRAQNAYVLRTGRVDGRPVWVVSFAKPTVPEWFTAWIDQKNYRTLRLRMTAASHFMFHRYVEFNGPLKIVPPSRRSGG